MDDTAIPMTVQDKMASALNKGMSSTPDEKTEGMKLMAEFGPPMAWDKDVRLSAEQQALCKRVWMSLSKGEKDDLIADWQGREPAVETESPDNVKSEDDAKIEAVASKLDAAMNGGQ